MYNNFEVAEQAAVEYLAAIAEHFPADSARTVEIEWQLVLIRRALSLPPQSRYELALADSIYQRQFLSVQDSARTRGGDAARWQRAVDAARRALVYYERHLEPPHPQIGRVYGGIGESYALQGRYREAVPNLMRSVMICEETLGEWHWQTRYAAGSLGAALARTGNYEASMAFMRSTLDQLERTVGLNNPEARDLMNNLGVTLRDLGRYAEAERIFAQLVENRRSISGARWPLGDALQNLGAARLGLQDLDGAMRSFNEALEIYESEDKGLRSGVCRSNIGSVWLHREVEDSAAVYYEAAERRFRAEGQEEFLAATLVSLATIEVERGDIDAAEDMFVESLTLRRQLLGEQHPETIESLKGLAVCGMRDGGFEAAAAMLEEAATAYEAARLRIDDAITRSTFVESPYELLAACRLALGDSLAAWESLRRGKGRSLLDLVERHWMRRAYEDLESSRYFSFDDMMRIGTLAASMHPSAQSSEDQAFMQGADAVFEAAAESLKVAIPSSLRDGLSLVDLQGVLKDGEAIIGWLDANELAGTSTWGYCIRSSGDVEWAALGPLPAQLAVGGEALASMGGTEATRAWSEAAWQYYFDPLANGLAGAQRLIVVPSRSLASVPIGAFSNPGGEYLADKHELSYSPSETVFAWVKAAPPRSVAADEGFGAVLVADPPFTERHGEQMEAEVALGGVTRGDMEQVGRLPRLPYSRTELESIEGYFDEPVVLLGSDASEQRIDELAKQGVLQAADVLHLATHAIVDSDEPEKSCLVLSQVDLPGVFESMLAENRVYDGLMSAGEIAELQINADLATLSACSTARGRLVQGEGYVGFAHAFFAAGARSVLISLWKVDDRATALFMEEFYRRWIGETGRPEATKSLALQETQLWMRDYTADDGTQPYSHPYYWSAFILVGDPD